MPIAQVPSLRTAVVHDTVVALGRGDEPRILRRIEEPAAIIGGIFKSPLQQLLTLCDHRLLTFAIARREHGAAIGRWLLLPRRQAAVALSSHLSGLRIDLVQIAQYGRDRAAHIVHVEAVEPDPRVRRSRAVVA